MVPQQFVMIKHEIGRLSKCAVLDVGLKCPHSCEFCYYSFLDNSEDQFRRIRNSPFKSLMECKESLDFFVKQGFERLDITGGEPLYHPDIVEIVRYAEKEKNLRVRMITLGQLFDRKDIKTGKRLLDALLEDAEISEFLFSLHSVDPELYYKITKGRFSKIEDAMDKLDSIGFEYCTNTVVYANNVSHIPAIARYLIKKKRRVHIANFITMNAYYAWSTGKAFGVQTRYSDLIEPLKEAVMLLEDAGIGVNVRYGPYCAFKGLEKNFVGIIGVLFDPYEWRNSTRNPFVVLAQNEKDAYEYQRKEVILNNKVFSAKCNLCALRNICDGIGADYLKKYGDVELQPYDGPMISDVVHFRRQNLLVFFQKQKININGTLLLPRRESISVNGMRWIITEIKTLLIAIRRFVAYKLHRRLYLAELHMRSSSDAPAVWDDAQPLTGKANRLLWLSPGSNVFFKVCLPLNAKFVSKILLLKKTDRSDWVEGIIEIYLSLEDMKNSVLRVWRWQVSSIGKWKSIRASLKGSKSNEVILRLSCKKAVADTGLRVALLEPSIITLKSIGYIIRFLYQQIRVFSFKTVYRKLRAYAFYSVRENEVDR